MKPPDPRSVITNGKYFSGFEPLFTKVLELQPTQSQKEQLTG